MSQVVPHIINAPRAELTRSPAALIISDLAARSELFLTHFEHRHHLSPPSYWLPPERPDLEGEVSWQRGKLKEHKFLHFRYDQPLGSFHPGHRAKWTTHELCHGVVGFAWHPSMTPFTHTLVARLAELLPVALWYFFDEVQLRRCPLHYLQGALFQEHCVYCERLATEGPRLPEPEDQGWAERGVAFVHAELAAIARSRRFKRPLPHRFATLDLNSDAMAFTAQNLKRYEDPYFRRFMERFHGPHTGCWSHLDDLEGRLLGVMESLRGGLPAPELTAGRAHWVAQDIGWRLLTIAAQCEDLEAVDALEQMSDLIAERPHDVRGVVTLYKALHEDFFIPEPEEVFALGYELVEGFGSDVTQLAKGVASACPTLELALGREGLVEQVRAFAPWDLARPTREPISRRFARFLTETGAGALSDLARYEAAINDPEPPDPWAACLAWHEPEGELVRRAQGVEVLSLGVDIAELSEALQRADEEMEISERPHHLLVVHKAGGTRELSEVSEEAARALELLKDGPQEAQLLGVRPEELSALKELGALTPCAWALERPLEPTHTSTDATPQPLTPDELDGAPLPDALWLESSSTAQAQPSLRADTDELWRGEPSASPPRQAASPQASPPQASPPQASTSLLELNTSERAPLNAFEHALREAIARERDPQAPSSPSPLDLEHDEDLFIFKNLDSDDDER